MAKLNFGGTEENVVTREEFPLSKAQEVLKNEDSSSYRLWRTGARAGVEPKRQWHQCNCWPAQKF